MFAVQSLPLNTIKAVFEHSMLRPFLFSLHSMTLVSFLRPAPNHPSSFHVSELFQAPIFIHLLPLLFHSLQLLLRSNYIFCKLWYIHDTFRNFPEIIGYVSNNEESQVSQSKCSPIPFHWRDNKNTFKQCFFKLMFYQCPEWFFPNRKRLFKQMYLLDMEKVVVFFHASVEKQVIMFSICTHD